MVDRAIPRISVFRRLRPELCRDFLVNYYFLFFWIIILFGLESSSLLTVLYFMFFILYCSHTPWVLVLSMQELFPYLFGN